MLLDEDQRLRDRENGRSRSHAKPVEQDLTAEVISYVIIELTLVNVPTNVLCAPKGFLDEVTWHDTCELIPETSPLNALIAKRNFPEPIRWLDIYEHTKKRDVSKPSSNIELERSFPHILYSLLSVELQRRLFVPSPFL